MGSEGCQDPFRRDPDEFTHAPFQGWQDLSCGVPTDLLGVEREPAGLRQGHARLGQGVGRAVGLGAHPFGVRD